MGEKGREEQRRESRAGKKRSVEDTGSGQHVNAWKKLFMKDANKL